MNLLSSLTEQDIIDILLSSSNKERCQLIMKFIKENEGRKGPRDCTYNMENDEVVGRGLSPDIQDAVDTLNNCLENSLNHIKMASHNAPMPAGTTDVDWGKLYRIICAHLDRNHPRNDEFRDAKAKLLELRWALI